MQQRNSFKGTIGFVLTAAGSAVGLGNIWRFPYLAAKDGGGLFLVVYIILALTFGFALLTSELAIGRRTKQGPLTAYSAVKKGAKPLGFLGCIVPMIILPYYCAIGGWVLKYFIVFVTGQGAVAAEDGFFTSFITGTTEPLIYFLIFLVACAVVIFRGVNNGIESLSKILMPILVVLILGIAIYSLTISHTDADGTTRTGIDGLLVYLIPNFDGVTVSKFITVVMDACGQLFYSLSVAMGIMITYGSYVKDKDNLSKSINRIELFDTVIAFLAGVLIIPAVFAFSGTDGLAASGPGLIFVSLPKVFMSMGTFGNVLGAVFFAMVFFAALTSAISIMEAVVSSFMDRFKMSRNKATMTEGIIALIAGACVCLGYNLFYFEYTLPNGSTGQILDILDYISNNMLMPLLAIGTCILIGWIVKPKYVIEELTKNGEKFGRKGLFVVMIKFIAPIILIILFLNSLGVINIM